MTPLGLHDDDGGLLCRRRPRLLCWLVLCDCPFDGAWCMVCESCRFAVVCVDLQVFPAFCIPWRWRAFKGFCVYTGIALLESMSDGTAV